MVSTLQAPTVVVAYDELLALQKDPAVAVVDVLAAESYAQAHIPGAVSAPLARLKELAAIKLPDKHQRVVTYCAGFA